MTTESAADAFERRYMAKFAALAGEHGVAVRYERDRAARDVGVHLTRKAADGSERLGASLVWFQMKGVMATTLPKAAYDGKREVSIPIDVEHLRFWYRQPMPTYLAVYVESADRFLVLNTTRYVDEHLGGRKIFDLTQKTVNVRVSKASVLDGQAFDLLYRAGELEEWQRVLDASPDDLQATHRDYKLIWRVATAAARGVAQRLTFRDWQSKMRSELYFEERPAGGLTSATADATADATAGSGGWRLVRSHWQFGLRVHQVEATYPYLEFSAWDEAFQDITDWEDNPEGEPAVTLEDETLVYGRNVADEYHDYEFAVALNDDGRRLWPLVEQLAKFGLVDVTADDEGEGLDVAPWHARQV